MEEKLTFIGRPAIKKKIEKELSLPADRFISYSQYSKYFKCPKAWELNYIHKIKEPSESIDVLFGQAMHTVIQLWLKTIYTESVKKANGMDLNSMLLAEMNSEYKLRKEKMGEHFSTPEQLSSYYRDGIEILNYLKKKRTAFFSTKKTELIGIEFPLSMKVHEDYPGIKLIGFIDLIFYSEISGKYTVIDLKTSTRGWNDYKKKDPFTTDQVLLYKKFMADFLGISPELVDVQFFILKRKLNEDVLWPQKRIQEFSPAAGKVSMNRVDKTLKRFIEECFNFDGTYKTDKNYPAMAGPNFRNCTFCVYNENENLCPTSNRICSLYE